jgi:hypothetical protein
MSSKKLFRCAMDNIRIIIQYQTTLSNRVTALEQASKRAQVAEKFLAAAVGEFGYAACADWLYQSAPRVHSSDPDAHDRLVQMARLLEEAARDA